MSILMSDTTVHEGERWKLVFEVTSRFLLDVLFAIDLLMGSNLLWISIVLGTLVVEVGSGVGIEGGLPNFLLRAKELLGWTLILCLSQQVVSHPSNIRSFSLLLYVFGILIA